MASVGGRGMTPNRRFQGTAGKLRLPVRSGLRPALAPEAKRWASQTMHMRVLSICACFAITVLSATASAKMPDTLPTIPSSLEATGTAECRGPMRQDIPYLDALRVAIERCFIYPPYLEDGARCVVRVSQRPNGTVTGVEVQNCTGHPKFADFIERAVLKASPLPRPARETSFLPTFGIIFSPNVEKFREALRAAPAEARELTITPASPRPPIVSEAHTNSSDKDSGSGPGKRFVSARSAGKYQPYVDACLRKVLDFGNKHYPPEAQGKLYGTAIVILTILPNGELDKVELARSSGHKVLDEAVIESARLAAPFGSFPSDMAQDVTALLVATPFTFAPRVSEQGEAQPIIPPDLSRQAAPGR